MNFYRLIATTTKRNKGVLFRMKPEDQPVEVVKTQKENLKRESQLEGNFFPVMFDLDPSFLLGDQVEIQKPKGLCSVVPILRPEGLELRVNHKKKLPVVQNQEVLGLGEIEKIKNLAAGFAGTIEAVLNTLVIDFDSDDRLTTFCKKEEEKGAVLAKLTGELNEIEKDSLSKKRTFLNELFLLPTLFNLLKTKGDLVMHTPDLKPLVNRIMSLCDEVVNANRLSPEGINKTNSYVYLCAARFYGFFKPDPPERGAEVLKYQFQEYCAQCVLSKNKILQPLIHFTYGVAHHYAPFLDRLEKDIPLLQENVAAILILGEVYWENSLLDANAKNDGSDSPVNHIISTYLFDCIVPYSTEARSKRAMIHNMVFEPQRAQKIVKAFKGYATDPYLAYQMAELAQGGSNEQKSTRYDVLGYRFLARNGSRITQQNFHQGLKDLGKKELASKWGKYLEKRDRIEGVVRMTNRSGSLEPVETGESGGGSAEKTEEGHSEAVVQKSNSLKVIRGLRDVMKEAPENAIGALELRAFQKVTKVNEAIEDLFTLAQYYLEKNPPYAYMFLQELACDFPEQALEKCLMCQEDSELFKVVIGQLYFDREQYQEAYDVFVGIDHPLAECFLAKYQDEGLNGVVKDSDAALARIKPLLPEILKFNLACVAPMIRHLKSSDTKSDQALFERIKKNECENYDAAQQVAVIKLEFTGICSTTCIEGSLAEGGDVDAAYQVCNNLSQLANSVAVVELLSADNELISLLGANYELLQTSGVADKLEPFFDAILTAATKSNHQGVTNLAMVILLRRTKYRIGEREALLADIRKLSLVSLKRLCPEKDIDLQDQTEVWQALQQLPDNVNQELTWFIRLLGSYYASQKRELDPLSLTFIALAYKRGLTDVEPFFVSISKTLPTFTPPRFLTENCKVVMEDIRKVDIAVRLRAIARGSQQYLLGFLCDLKYEGEEQVKVFIFETLNRLIKSNYAPAKLWLGKTYLDSVQDEKESFLPKKVVGLPRDETVQEGKRLLKEAAYGDKLEANLFLAKFLMKEGETLNKKHRALNKKEAIRLLTILINKECHADALVYLREIDASRAEQVYQQLSKKVSLEGKAKLDAIYKSKKKMGGKKKR